VSYIKNYSALASNEHRKVVLELIEAAFTSIAPDAIFKNEFKYEDNILHIQKQKFNLDDFHRVFLIGFGKGSSGICKRIEEKLGDKLTAGFDIDVVYESFQKINYTKGTHPLPSQENINYTHQVLEATQGLTEKDLVLVVICGGGSVMFEKPYKVSLDKLTETVKALLKSGANITEMNVIRKHLSSVKGGGLAKHLFPATVASLIFSDVPGNDLSVIASGPTVPDHTSMNQVKSILKKYNLAGQVTVTPNDFTETTTQAKYFAKVHNILMLSNLTAIHAMEMKARELGYKTYILTDKLQGDARELGKKLLDETAPGEILLAGGESTIKITGKGKGGRNQALVVSSLPYIKNDKTTLAAFDSDGWDFYGFAGAIADSETIRKAKEKNEDPKKYLKQDNSYEFLEKIGEGIDTGKLESNVSDLYIVLKA
jgi:glycerate-2-kinase